MIAPYASKRQTCAPVRGLATLFLLGCMAAIAFVGSGSPARQLQGAASRDVNLDVPIQVSGGAEWTPPTPSAEEPAGVPKAEAAASSGAARQPTPRWFDLSMGLISTEVVTNVPVTVGVGDEAVAGAFELDKQIFAGLQDPPPQRQQQPQPQYNGNLRPAPSPAGAGPVGGGTEPVSAFASTVGTGLGFADDPHGAPVDVFGRRHAELSAPASSVSPATPAPVAAATPPVEKSGPSVSAPAAAATMAAETLPVEKGGSAPVGARAAATLSTPSDVAAGDVRAPTPRWFDANLGLVHTQVNIYIYIYI